MNKKILVVDDDPSVRQLLKNLLTDEGYDVHTAENGEKALELLKKTSIPVMYIDMQMPQMEGLELGQKIKEFNPIAWIAAITGNRALFEITQCRDAGFDDYFTKPLDLSLIIESAKEAFTKITRWRGSAD